MKSLFILLTVQLMLCVYLTAQTCELMDASMGMCNDLGYGTTTMPNTLGHTTQHEAFLELSYLEPLIRIQCASDLELFLCSLHIPKCIPGFNETVMPCRDLCEGSQHGCERIMQRYGFAWPAAWHCDRFPLRTDQYCLKNKV